MHRSLMSRFREKWRNSSTRPMANGRAKCAFFIRALKTFIAMALVCATTLATSGAAFAACTTASPDAITSKPAAAAEGSQPAAADAKGIAEDGQHTPLETDPNAPGVTQSAGGTTTNTAQAETEIAAASATGTATTDGATTGSTTAAAGTDDTACPN